VGNPTTWFDCTLSSATLERTELILGNCANHIRAVPFTSIRFSGNRRFSPSGRWREMRPALSRFAPSPPSNQFVPFRVS
jgi:hypothetical protein